MSQHSYESAHLSPSQGGNDQGNGSKKTPSTSAGTSSKPSNRGQQKKSPIPIKVVQDEEIQGLSVSSGMPPRTERQIANAYFKWENTLRDMVLSLSDHLEAIDYNFKVQIIQNIEAESLELANALSNRYLKPATLQSSVGQQKTQACFQATSFNPSVQGWMMQNFVRPSLTPILDYRLTHEEILSLVLREHGSEVGREQFLSEIIQMISGGQFVRLGRDPSRIMNVNADLVRNLTYLASDHVALAKKNIIQQTITGIQQMKTSFYNSLKENMVESWPIIETVHRENELVFRTFLGFDYEDEDVKVFVNAQGTQLSIVGKGQRKFCKVQICPSPIETSSIDAVKKDGILVVTTKRQK